MPTRDELIRYYATLHYDRLLALAVNEAAQLTPEALGVLREEVHRRGLDNVLRDAIEIQTRRVEPAEQEELVQRFRKLPCPICNAQAALLNGARVATAYSFLVMTTYQEGLVIGCPQCILAAARKANRATAAFAWWGIPWGPIRGLKAMWLIMRPAQPPNDRKLQQISGSTLRPISVKSRCAYDKDLRLSDCPGPGISVRV